MDDVNKLIPLIFKLEGNCSNYKKNDPSQLKFLKGWINRLNDFKFT